jgi:low temperature requirement protein LtrA
LRQTLAATDGERQIRLARGGYTFLHLPMIVGIVLLSLGLKKAIGYVAGVDEHTLADPLYGVPLAVLFGGTALYLLAHVWFKHLLTGVLSVVRISAAALIVVLTPLMAFVPALVSLAVLTVVAMALVGWETHRFRELRHAIRHGQHG